ncbi:MAG: DUF2709 domain-containing protein [Parachlamydiales bacterium]
MAHALLSEEVKKKLAHFIEEHKKVDLLGAYLFFLEQRFQLAPVVFPVGKTIYQSKEEAIKRLEQEGKLWREAQIQVRYSKEAVNENTKKIYICPFTGKVFGDNTHPNPQDAIYDWVSKCPENTERIGGLPVKRFYVSEDPEVIRSYIKPSKEAITKTVYSSVISGKLFSNKRAVIQDFVEHYLKPISLNEAQSQNRFEIEAEFLAWIQSQLEEERLGAFVQELADDPTFEPHVARWLG